MLKAAFYETCITPYLYDTMPGYFEARYCTEVLDELYAHALALESEKENCIILSLDCICIERRDVEKIRRRVFDATGVTNVSVSGIHNHTGGPVATLYGSPRNERYCEFLCVKAADAAILAWQRREPAKFGWAVRDVEGLSFNRRFLFRDGHVDMNPGVNNPEVVRGTDIIDPQLITARIDYADGRLMGILASFALHLDSVDMPQGFSADYPGVIREGLHKKYGEDVGFVWLTGCCGNINHLDTTGKIKLNHRIVGEKLTAYISELADGIRTDDRELTVASRTITATIERPTPEMIAKAPAGPRQREMTIAMGLPGGTVDCEVVCVGLGDFAIAALPGEVFCRFGLDIKKRSPYACTLTAELSNASNGYVKTREAADEGGYEATPSTYNILDRNAGYLMADAAVENLLGMKK